MCLFFFCAYTRTASTVRKKNITGRLIHYHHFSYVLNNMAQPPFYNSVINSLFPLPTVFKPTTFTSSSLLSRDPHLFPEKIESLYSHYQDITLPVSSFVPTIIEQLSLKLKASAFDPTFSDLFKTITLPVFSSLLTIISFLINSALGFYNPELTIDFDYPDCFFSISVPRHYVLTFLKLQS